MKPKIKKTIMWILIGLLALQFTSAGLPKFTGSWDTKFADWGYPSFFVYLIGLVEIVGIIGLFIRKTRKWAVIALMLTMIGAAITHALNDEASRLIHNFILIALLVSVFYLHKVKSLD